MRKIIFNIVFISSVCLCTGLTINSKVKKIKARNKQFNNTRN